MAEQWSEHERWADTPRCTVETCQQPLTHPDSVRDQVCRRPGEEHEQARAAAQRA